MSAPINPTMEAELELGPTILMGPPGDSVSLQVSSTHVQWRQGDGPWTNLIALADLMGESGNSGTNGTNGLDGSDGEDGLDAQMIRLSTALVSIGFGSKSFPYTVTANNLGWTVGTRLRAYASAGNYMEGEITSVDNNEVTITSDLIVGTGNHSDWTLGITGEPGTAGETGADGADGENPLYIGSTPPVDTELLWMDTTAVGFIGDFINQMKNAVDIDGGSITGLNEFSVHPDARVNARNSLGLVIGTDVQAYDTDLAAIAALTSVADSLPYFTGAGAAALTTLTTFARSLIDDPNQETMLSTLGLTNVTAGRFGNGSAGTPGIAFTADTDTGLYSPGADQFALVTGGVQRMLLSTTTLTMGVPMLVPAGTAADPSYGFAEDSGVGLFRAGTDQIGFAAAGAQRALLTASAFQLDVPMTGTAVQSGPADTTSGRLMPVGAFGLGRNSAIAVTQLNDLAATGFYSITAANAAAGNAPTANTFTVLHQQYDSNAAVQTAFQAAGTTEVRMWQRIKVSGTWQTWTLNYMRSNVLGAVTQVGGLPTGALIESGSNANGLYTRLASGLQICRVSLAASASAGVIWTFPAAFSTAPVITGTAVATVLSAVCLDAAPDSTTATFSARDKTDARRADTCHLTAIGRWF